MSITGLTRRVVNWDIDEAVQEPEPTTPVPFITPVQNTTTFIETRTPNEATVTRPKITRNRIGNGHKKQMVRKLINAERDFLRAEFRRLNGQIAEDDCVRMKTMVDQTVGIWQVTGFVSYLHREVALGRTVLRNLESYCVWMESKYPKLWAQWNKPAFISVRNVNRNNRMNGRPMVNIPVEQAPITPQFSPSSSPTFTAFKRRGSFFRGN